MMATRSASYKCASMHKAGHICGWFTLSNNSKLYCKVTALAHGV